MQEKYAAVDRECNRLEHTGTPPSPELDALLEARGEPPVKDGARLADLLRRPRLSYADLAPFDPQRPAAAPAATREVEITVKYQGYIQRQLRQVEEMHRLEERPLPADLDYQSIQGLRLEARQKLEQIRPQNLGQASRVSGVSPADVAVLMVYLKARLRRTRGPMKLTQVKGNTWVVEGIELIPLYRVDEGPLHPAGHRPGGGAGGAGAGPAVGGTHPGGHSVLPRPRGPLRQQPLFSGEVRRPSPSPRQEAGMCATPADA